jgi:hypothetical protein
MIINFYGDWGFLKELFGILWCMRTLRMSLCMRTLRMSLWNFVVFVE